MNDKEKLLADKEKLLAEYTGEDEVLSFAEIIKRDAGRSAPSVKATCGPSFSRLNKLIDGFHGGELIAVSGLPKSGKTLFLQTLTYNLGFQNLLTLWLSYEMPIVDFVSRFPGFPTIPLSFAPAKLTTNAMTWLDDRILEAKIKHNIRVVAIDHLHYLVDMARISSPSLEIGSILRALVGMARKHNVIIFLIAHTGKVAKGDKPTGASIRDSSFILQEPATVLMVYRIKDKPIENIINQAWVSVEVSRRVGTMQKRVRVIKGQNGLLAELDLTPEEMKRDEEDEED